MAFLNGAAGENILGKQESEGHATFIDIFFIYQINGICCVFTYMLPKY